MSLQACANLVARADPDRFAAVMAAPFDARAVLLPIYAAAAEVARAPWMTQEPVIAEMRLQWWRDVFEEMDQVKELLLVLLFVSLFLVVLLHPLVYQLVLIQQ